MLAKFLQGYSLQVLFTLPVRRQSALSFLLLFDLVFREDGVTPVVPSPLEKRLKRQRRPATKCRAGNRLLLLRGWYDADRGQTRGWLVENPKYIGLVIPGVVI